MAHRFDTPLASFKGVHKHYGRTRALDGVDLELHRGQVLALLGTNGAGKTTAIALLLGLVRPDAGEVRLSGRDPGALATRRRVGVMLQSGALPPTLKVQELLDLTRSYYAAPRSLADCVAIAGLDGLLGRRYDALSGGQQRRVQFALAICGRPALLVLDEPTTGLDIAARQGLWRGVRDLVAEGASVLLTTHYLEEAEALADRVVVLAAGRVAAEGSLDAVRARVDQRRIRCVTTLDAAAVSRWPGVRSAVRDGAHLHIVAAPAEDVARRLLAADPALSDLDVVRAGLAEAFLEITRDAPRREAA